MIELAKKEPVKWFFRPYSLIIAFLVVGPLMLPLVWLHPRYNIRKKIIATLVIIFITYFLGVIVYNSLMTIIEYYQLVF